MSDGRHREVPQPPTQGPRRRDHPHAPEALDDRGVRHVAQVAQPAAPDDQLSDHDAHHRHDAEVAPRRTTGKRVSHQTVEVDAAQVAREQFQPGVRRERHVIEFERKIPIDTGRQISFSSSHVPWPFVCGRTTVTAVEQNHATHGKGLSLFLEPGSRGGGRAPASGPPSAGRRPFCRD